MISYKCRLTYLLEHIWTSFLYLSIVGWLFDQNIFSYILGSYSKYSKDLVFNPLSINFSHTYRKWILSKNWEQTKHVKYYSNKQSKR